MGGGRSSTGDEGHEGEEGGCRSASNEGDEGKEGGCSPGDEGHEGKEGGSGSAGDEGHEGKEGGSSASDEGHEGEESGCGTSKEGHEGVMRSLLCQLGFQCTCLPAHSLSVTGRRGSLGAAGPNRPPSVEGAVGVRR